MANKFWVGGTGTWDGGTLDNGFWKTATGGSTTTTAPTTADTAIFDSLSGGGIVTIVGNQTVGGCNDQTHTGTLDFATSNITFNGVVNFSGGGTRTIKYGSGTHTFIGTLNMGATGLTLDVGTATIIQRGGGTMMAGLNAHRLVIPSIGTASFTQWAGSGQADVNYLETQNVYGSAVLFTINGYQLNVKNNFHLAGRPKAPIYIRGVGGTGSLTVDAGKSGFIDWTHIHGTVIGSGITLRNCYDGLGNSGSFLRVPTATAIGAL